MGYSTRQKGGAVLNQPQRGTFFFPSTSSNILLVCLNNKHQGTKVLSKNAELVSAQVACNLDA